jgi:hypothetical protein
MLPALEQNDANIRSEFLPEIFFASPLFATGLVKNVRQLQNLMDKEGDQVKKEKIEGQVFLPVSIVVLNVITLVFKCIEGTSSYLPALSRTPQVS